MGCGSVGFYMKGELKGELAVSRNWITLAGTVPLGPARPQDVKVLEYKQ